MHAFVNAFPVVVFLCQLSTAISNCGKVMSVKWICVLSQCTLNSLQIPSLTSCINSASLIAWLPKILFTAITSSTGGTACGSAATPITSCTPSSCSVFHLRYAKFSKCMTNSSRKFEQVCLGFCVLNVFKNLSASDKLISFLYILVR